MFLFVGLFVRVLVRTCSYSYVPCSYSCVFLLVRVLIRPWACSYVFLFVRVLIRTYVPCSYSCVFLFVRVLIRPWAWKVIRGLEKSRKYHWFVLSHEMAFCSWQNARLGRFGCRWSSGNILTIPIGHKSNAIITKITQCQERHNWKSSENQKGNKNQTFWAQSGVHVLILGVLILGGGLYFKCVLNRSR